MVVNVYSLNIACIECNVSRRGSEYMYPIMAEVTFPSEIQMLEANFITLWLSIYCNGIYSCNRALIFSENNTAVQCYCLWLTDVVDGVQGSSRDSQQSFVWISFFCLFIPDTFGTCSVEPDSECWLFLKTLHSWCWNLCLTCLGYFTKIECQK